MSKPMHLRALLFFISILYWMPLQGMTAQQEVAQALCDAAVLMAAYEYQFSEQHPGKGKIFTVSSSLLTQIAGQLLRLDNADAEKMYACREKLDDACSEIGQAMRGEIRLWAPLPLEHNPLHCVQYIKNLRNVSIKNLALQEHDLDPLKNKRRGLNFLSFERCGEIYFPDLSGELLEELVLDATYIAKETLPNLAKLRSLKDVTVKNSQITKSFFPLEPLYIKHELVIDHCLIKPEPDSLSSLSKINGLQILRLHNNRGVAFIPAISSLDILEVNGCSGIHLLLQNSNKLSRVEIKHSGIVANTLKELAAVPSLKEIILPGNNLTTIPQIVPNRITGEGLIEVNVSKNNLDQASIDRLLSSEYLQKLDLSENGLSDFPAVASKNLTSLTLSNNTLLPDAIKNICMNTKLEDLNLSNNQLTTLPEYIAKLQNLSDLRLQVNQIPYQELEKLQANKRLELLDLTGNKTIQDIPDEFIQNLPQLKFLSLFKTGVKESRKMELVRKFPDRGLLLEQVF